MKHFSQFFSCFFLFLSILGTTSCRKNPPVLKRGKTEKLQQVCTALQQQKNNEALDIIRRTPELSGTPLAGHLKSQERDRALVRRLNQALLQQKYSLALNIIQEAEQNGQASAEILKLKDLPYALQALQLFCVRMPWEDAASLQKNWSFLAQHEDLLMESPAFQTFRQEQFNLLKSFRQEATQAEISLMMAKIDGCSAGGRPDEAWQLAGQLKKKYPMHVFSRLAGTRSSRAKYLTDLLGGRQELADGDAAAFELALALNWTKLSGADQANAGRILRNLEKKETVSGTLLEAVFLNSGQALLSALNSWQKVAGPGQTLPDYFQTALLKKFHQDSAFPGIFPLLRFFQTL